MLDREETIRVRLLLATVMGKHEDKLGTHMKHYVYLSDQIVDMYYDQIPRSVFSSLKGEIKINFGLVDASLKTPESVSNRFLKVAAVVTHLRQEQRIGTVEQPNSYFSGVLEMQWGGHERMGTVCFLGFDNEHIVGLGGSARHVVGNAMLDTQHSNHNELEFLPHIIERFKRNHDRNEFESREDIQRHMDPVVDLAYKVINAPKAKYEFVAVRHAEWLLEDKHVIVGTPIS